ncbi:type II secretion system minor pseudopilin GspH [Thioalkalivibrio paradoxus]|uniref:Type II secretion system protein H n=1 Tax=Thioalkalivibrio paradoxus ARh 1 TaxID=713585 RepID=W0DE75_9GAMM|nr:type II secretion system minor pseudopilin GspH [Thioalkalivibrio paradoxus]AHE96939.1 general secretion pathway protein H [Thioalkalivibrio paradoxus ARh 1]
MAAPARGFTLFELLVVLLILGLVAGFAVLAVGGAPSRVIEQEARRMVELAGLARDEALLTGQERALGFSRDGYAFLEQVLLDDDRVTWVEVERTPLGPRSLERLGLELRLRQQNRAVPLDERADRPQVLFNGAGEVTPFELELRTAQAGAVLRITGLPDGRLEWETLR